MRSLRLVLVTAIALAAPAARADVTARYRCDIKSVGIAMQGDATASAIRLKGTKGSWTEGGLTAIVDFAKQEITVVDSAHRRYATVPAAQYLKAQLAAMPHVNQAEPAPNSMKTKVETKQTGRTDTIQGIKAEEREITATIGIPLPEGMAESMPAMKMTMTMQIWTPKSSEAPRLPALRDLAAFSDWQEYFMNPAGALAAMPGASDFLDPLIAALKGGGGPILRSHMEFSMATGGASAPLMQMNQELVELSDARVDDSLLEVPKDYAAAPLEELMKASAAAVEEAMKAAPADSPAPARPSDIKAYVPSLNPLHRVEAAYPNEAKDRNVHGIVECLITLDPAGNVAEVEPLTGPELLRKPAINAVKQWKYRPVIRDGVPVKAYTTETVDFWETDDDAAGAASFNPGELDLAAEMAAEQRKAALEREMPRSPAQVLADLEQDSGGGDATRRFNALDGLAKAALDAGAPEKAAAYANEFLKAAETSPEDWNRGNAIHDGHMVLGLVALRADDTAEARLQLLEAGRTPGSPQLNSFGPNMTLAKELLDKGETGAVLEYFTRCRAFWKSGGKQLDAWSTAVSAGKTPNFGANLAY